MTSEMKQFLFELERLLYKHDAGLCGQGLSATKINGDQTVEHLGFKDNVITSDRLAVIVDEGCVQ